MPIKIRIIAVAKKSAHYYCDEKDVEQLLDHKSLFVDNRGSQRYLNQGQSAIKKIHVTMDCIFKDEK